MGHPVSFTAYHYAITDQMIICVLKLLCMGQLILAVKGLEK